MDGKDSIMEEPIYIMISPAPSIVYTYSLAHRFMKYILFKDLCPHNIRPLRTNKALLINMLLHTITINLNSTLHNPKWFV